MIDDLILELRALADRLDAARKGTANVAIERVLTEACIALHLLSGKILQAVIAGEKKLDIGSPNVKTGVIGADAGAPGSASANHSGK